MCSLTIAGIAVSAVSTGLQMLGQSSQQKAQERAAQASAQYNIQVSEQEAETQRQLARNELAKGAADRERQQREAQRQLGKMRASMAASGFQLDSGTNLSLLAESAAEHQYDSEVISSNAEQAAWQRQMAGLNATNQGNLYQWQSNNANSNRGASWLGMGGTLLGGIGAGIGAYNQYNQSSSPQNRPGLWDRMQNGINTTLKR